MFYHVYEPEINISISYSHNKNSIEMTYNPNSFFTPRYWVIVHISEIGVTRGSV